MRNPEPFRIKMVEPIKRTTRRERESLIAATGMNLFDLRAQDVAVDLLTDSGTGAMSQEQWAALMRGDESYAGSRSYHRLKDTVEDVFGFPHVLPTHQGRAAEHLFFGMVLERGGIVVSNGHFDTTRAHVEISGATAIDIPCRESFDPEANEPFKGNIDLDRLAAGLAGPDLPRVKALVMTITNNTGGGQPVSLANLSAAATMARQHDIPVVFDIARFAENAWFIKEREAGYQDREISSIVREMMSHADVLLMSAKKDGLVNIGGLVCSRDADLNERLGQRSIVYEGFPTYGGLAGRDIDALAVGLREVLDERYLKYRVGQVSMMAESINEAGVPTIQPAGGHAVYVDAGKLLPHIPPEQFPAQALGCALYVEGGIRGVEIGSNMMGRDPETGENRHPDLELLRLAIPRRTYTHTQLDVVAEALGEISARPQVVRGLKMTYEAPVLRHFTAKFTSVGADMAAASSDLSADGADRASQPTEFASPAAAWSDEN